MADAGKREPLLSLRGVKKYFPVKRGMLRAPNEFVRAVDDVDLDLFERETLGLVGESGCGKTTLGRCILRLLDTTEGTIEFSLDEETIDLASLSRKQIRPLRRHMQMVFQDPFSSLDPRMTVLDIVGEPLTANRMATGEALTERVKEIVQAVGLEMQHLKRYPHAFSGGQRQRIGVARALAPSPKLIVCDEPVSALDVSVQAQVINLLMDLQQDFGLTYLFISHDLGVVEHVCDRVAVMYVGRIVELSETEALFKRPLHPYSEALLAAVPVPDPELEGDLELMGGDVPDPAHPPPGCTFHPRCKYAVDACRTRVPGWRELPDGRCVACHRADELDLTGRWADDE